MHTAVRHWMPGLIVLFALPALASADPKTDAAALEGAAQAWVQAFNARNADALLALATQDVVLMDPTLPPVSGHKAAREAWERAVGLAKDPVSAATKEAVVEGDVAWRIAAVTRPMPGSVEPARGQVLEIWKRVGGEWKLHRQMSSTLLVPPRMLPRPLPPEPVLDTPIN